jgi:hypothetical protein
VCGKLQHHTSGLTPYDPQGRKEGGTAATYGLCSSEEAQCSLSYNSSVLNRLHGIMQIIYVRGSKGIDIPEGIVSDLRRFRISYQNWAECSECREPLIAATQSAMGIAHEFLFRHFHRPPTALRNCKSPNPQERGFFSSQKTKARFPHSHRPGYAC